MKGQGLKIQIKVLIKKIWGFEFKVLGFEIKDLRSKIRFYWYEIKFLGLNFNKHVDCIITWFYINMLRTILK
jgi:hypothetical protein